MSSNNTYNRKQLAKAYCESLVGNGIADFRSGLFLAGPRRVGKTTFLIEDLIPEAESREWEPIYVDLWSDRSKDPALLIKRAITHSAGKKQSKFARVKSKLQPKKMSILNTLELDISEDPEETPTPIVDNLKDISLLFKKPILLVIDEAQHALSSKAGLNAMFALKSARDQLNIGHGSQNLILVMTGSNRNKLAQLVIKKDQPFFGSDITSFPYLGRDYTDFYTDRVNETLADHNQFSKDSMWKAFQLLGYRPEILSQIVGKIAINNEASSFSNLLKENTLLWQTQMWEEFDQSYNQLPNLHRAILNVLIEKDRSWSPFSEDSINRYKEITGLEKISLSSVQTAIETLRERGFIWQSGRGIYDLEDDSFGEWFKKTQQGMNR